MPLLSTIMALFCRILPKSSTMWASFATITTSLTNCFVIDSNGLVKLTP